MAQNLNVQPFSSDFIGQGAGPRPQAAKKVISRFRSGQSLVEAAAHNISSPTLLLNSVCHQSLLRILHREAQQPESAVVLCLLL